MKRYSKTNFHDSLIQIGITKGDILFVQSSLLSLGLIKSIEINSQPTEILKILLDIVGKEGTIAAPTFNFDFCNGIPFSKLRTPSKKMGVFSEVVRNHPDAQRSSHPMQSIAAIGYHAQAITANDTMSAFSENGSFDIMTRLNAKLLFLGASIQSTALIHMVEEQLKVPYRYWKEFNGFYSIGNEPALMKTYKLYVRSEILKPVLSLNFLGELLQNEGKMRSVNVGTGKISSILFDDFLNVATFMVSQDPFRLLGNRNEVLQKYNEILEQT
jgi:aminoglycoside 3-N-acetyltransferase